MLNPNEAPSDISATLAERGKRYGIFANHADISQGIKQSMRVGNWDQLAPDQREALEMIAHKIGRILNGDPNYPDNFLDIGGYATLVLNRLQEKESKESAK